jgi:DNA-binding winged helix-turn-helix (wHTH) protein
MKLTFADFALDSATRELAQDGRALHLSPKAFDLLVLLLERRPGVVDKETIREKLWPGTNVVDANLNNLASEIRSALGDDSQQPRFVRTVHRVGYAFCGAVEVEAPDGTASSGGRMFLVWDERRILLSAKTQTIGRDPECAIWIDVPGVSRRHARIRLDRAGESAAAVLEDLDSTNGTFVDGKRVSKPVTLVDGQSIKVGEATLTFRAWSDSGGVTKRIRRK